MTETQEPTTEPYSIVGPKHHEAGPQACPACSLALEVGANYCPQCGRTLAEVKTNSPAQSTKEIEESFQVSKVAPNASDEGSPAPIGQPEPVVPGDVFLSAKSEPDKTARHCTCCGRELPAEYHYCYQCGTIVGQRQPQYLLRSIGKSNDAVVTMTKPELTIGKLDECDLVIADDDYVSRRHARLFRSDGMVFLEDMGSANGTFLRVRRPIVLELGDEILVGTAVLQLEDSVRPV